ncbi:ABC transporter permease [Mucilaginibacter sp. X4EP1]|uniref:ABC transporter permease n=1 Tax=Mucilaginibacter sp. X4EP1 TaxID=2723092 RepID=UPI0021682FDD|nr:ABC transporter permease [Mucilaginibacter sp. X4EP1]MCS3815659.1 ABC-2 type transport system permease protein [Mucilaginibacter sp. X4EP1]
MKKTYSNFNATMAIAVASFRSIIRSPSAVVFSLAFPLIFIVVFANIGGSPVKVDVGVAKTCDTINPVFQALKKANVLNLITDQSTDEMNKNLSKGTIDVILDIKNTGKGWAIYPPLSAIPQKQPFTINVQYTKASQKGGIFKSVLNSVTESVNKALLIKIFGQNPENLSAVQLHETTIQGREYKYIDFLLPGMLGFSLLSSGVFGTAFVFLSLRLTLVIKRFFATPVKKYSIVLGEAIARLIFSWIGALFIILVGHYAFGFTLVHGLTTVVNMLILSAIGLIVFMGFGFIISGVAKNESTVPPLSNIITLPQFLLSGTFFATTAFPTWLQGLSNILPLTYLNKAMRDVAFEGAGLGDVTHDLLILGIWFIIVYAVAVRTFKWE